MDTQANLEQRLRTMRTLWIAMLLSISAYYVFTFFTRRSENISPNRTLSLILLGVALLTTLMSFLVRNMLLTRAVEQQQVQLVQQGYIVAWAVTEFAALLGLLDFFLTGNRYFYLLFIIAACGMLLHFPQREPVINAGFKSATSLSGVQK
jgi:NADH:ubiquinone oxidoreductase subunit 2 (subunit N)